MNQLDDQSVLCWNILENGVCEDYKPPENLTQYIHHGWDIYIHDAINSSTSVFSFTHFLSALALLVALYAITDIRYKFRLRIAPIPLFATTYIAMIIIGIGTLVIDVWSASQWPNLDSFVNHFILQAILGGIFMLLVLGWIFFAFINPPIFSRFNAERYARELFRIILRGSESELSMIAAELILSAKNIIFLSAPAPSKIRPQNKNNKIGKANQLAYEVLLIMGSRRLCRYIVSQSPMTAMKFFEQFCKFREKPLPIGQFVQNISAEAILNKDSLLYHEDEGYNAGLLGYIRPFTNALYGNFELLEILSDENSSPLNIDYKIKAIFDAEQFKVYTTVTLKALEAYLVQHEKGFARSPVFYDAFRYIENTAREIYKIRDIPDYYSSEFYQKFSHATEFVYEAVKLLNKYDKNPAPLRQKKSDGSLYDLMAELMFKIILAAASIKSPPDTCWTIHYNTAWTNLFSNYDEEGKAQKVLEYRLRRKIYDEFSNKQFFHYQSAAALGICLNVLGPVIRKNSGTGQLPLHKAMLSWVRKNYLTLRAKHPHIADACLIGSISYDEKEKRLVKTYIRGLESKAPTEFLFLGKERPRY